MEDGKTITERLDELNNETLDLIENYIVEGYKTTLAKLLVYSGKERSEKILEKLPSDLQNSLKELLAKMPEKTMESPDVMSEAGQALKKMNFQSVKTGEDFAESYSALPTIDVMNAVKSIYAKNPLLSIILDKEIIRVDDVLQLDDRDLQKLLREVDTEVLAVVLSKSSEEVQEKFYRNMSRRAAAMLREDIEFLGPVSETDIVKNRNQLISIMRGLLKKDRIHFRT